ncbi:MAG: flavodoxin [Arcobacter sp.]|jgi:flavodoxin I|uniref:Flavodoxin n=1 Tax=Arcobacter defluvii TaxID=873191 RepID=A0AAE7BFX3_9BACT|nr:MULTISPECIES: flavodoxin [Arcobacter]MDY3201372.1 flavodoxin [Arcobacter sp.]QKF78343.1 flavodoxin [Arcobacter defluvii]RXI30207.1 flavodoxin [Arcobacter defluvii]BAK74140.1 flavodoxin [Arcobacter sp. L]
MATAIFFASSTGNSEEIANKIASKLGDIEVFDLAGTKIDKINEYDKLIFGGSTWGDGELNDDWEDAWGDFSKLDLSNKTVALFGLGDQESYSDEFCSALGIIYEQIKSSGAKVIGFTSTEGYYHDGSKAQIDTKFVGLVIDEDNQSDLTEERIENWVNEIKAEIL